MVRGEIRGSGDTLGGAPNPVGGGWTLRKGPAGITRMKPQKGRGRPQKASEAHGGIGTLFWRWRGTSGWFEARLGVIKDL